MSSFLSAIHRLPDVAILCLVVLVVAGLSMAAPHVGRRGLRLRVNASRSEATLDAYKAVMTMTGVVLAFALVEANGNLHAIEGLVAREGAALAAADRALLRSGNPQLAVLRPSLAAYGRSVVEDEWPLLAEVERSDATDDAYDEISKRARAVSPTDARQQAMFAELLKALDDLADLREQRIAESEADLPPFFWVAAAGLLLVAFVLALLTADTLATSVSLGAAAAAVALVFSFVAIVDQPFEGETSVKPKEIVKALALNARRG